MTEQLIIYPTTQLGSAEKVKSLTAVLQNTGLIADNPELAGFFNAGGNFPGLISFLGCSPDIKDAEDNIFSTIELNHFQSGIKFLGGKNITSPTCVSCKQKQQNMQKLIQSWQNNINTKITCPNCKTENLIPDLNWHYRAGFSNYEIAINNILEGTALPSDALLNLLEQHTNSTWQHFYRQI